MRRRSKAIKVSVILLIAALFLSACASTPVDPTPVNPSQGNAESTTQSSSAGSEIRSGNGSENGNWSENESGSSTLTDGNDSGNPAGGAARNESGLTNGATGESGSQIIEVGESGNQVDGQDESRDSSPVGRSESGSQASRADGSEFTVYFIDVGQADSELIVCDGHAMLIDGGNVADSSLIYSFLDKHGVSHLDYMIATHAHEDHVGGLAGALNYATVGAAYCPVPSFDSKAFANFLKYLDEQGVTVTVPGCGDSFKLGGADVTILGPMKASDEPNNTSIVIKVTYGDTSFLFTGDAERAEEQDILAAGYDLSATVLKVGHHGSETSTAYPFLREIMPRYAVISCGENNIYGHPDDNTLSRLRDADVTVYRTDMQGTIVCTSDGNAVSFSTERNATTQTNPTAQPAPLTPLAQGITYIGNINTKKFHFPTCSGLPLEKNRTYFDSREEAVSAGYSPCGICKP